MNGENPVVPPDYTISSRRRLEMSAGELRHLITHPETWPEWQTEIESAEGPEELTEGATVEGDARMLGFRVKGHADMDRVEETTISHQVIVGVKMQVRYDLEPDGDGVVVTHTLTADMPEGLAGKVLSILLRRRLRTMQRKLLDNLAERRSHG
jgi:Polyketide cyclase / dehydrase and lipid transport